MRKRKVKRVIVHSEGVNRAVLAERVSAFHIDIIERRLEGASMTNAQKIAIIQKISERLRV